MDGRFFCLYLTDLHEFFVFRKDFKMGGIYVISWVALKQQNILRNMTSGQVVGMGVRRMSGIPIKWLIVTAILDCNESEKS